MKANVKYRFAPRRKAVKEASAPSPSLSEKGVSSFPVQDLENPYARFFTRGRSFAELLPHRKP
jgi:hypothetical protein